MSKNNSPIKVWLELLPLSNRMKYSKSGIMLPMISPFIEYIFRGKYRTGKIKAGWEKVNPITTIQLKNDQRQKNRSERALKIGIGVNNFDNGFEKIQKKS